MRMPQPTRILSSENVLENEVDGVDYKLDQDAEGNIIKHELDYQFGVIPMRIRKIRLILSIVMGFGVAIWLWLLLDQWMWGVYPLLAGIGIGVILYFYKTDAPIYTRRGF